MKIHCIKMNFQFFFMVFLSLVLFLDQANAGLNLKGAFQKVAETAVKEAPNVAVSFINCQIS